jgi:D-arabinose 1-dehydrogenase-like Zn-dependent alcohol dehydrogenase
LTSRITAAAFEFEFVREKCRRYRKNQLLVVLGLTSAEQSGREYLYEALDYVAKGKVSVMTETFPLDDIADAYERADNGNVHFRAV